MHRCQYILGTGERFQRLKPTEGVKVIIQKPWLWTIIGNVFEECHALWTLRTSFTYFEIE